MMRRTTLVIALGTSACVFGSPGGNGDDVPELGQPDQGRTPGDPPPGGAPEGEDAGDDPGTDDGRVPGDDGQSGDQPLPPPSDTTPRDDDGTDDGADDGTGDGSVGETGDAVDCDGFVNVLWAEDAAIDPPMELGEAVDANGTPKVALSGVAEAGDVTFQLDLPCAGEFHVYGLVWDYTPGAWQDPDADSFYVDVGGPEFVWRYGCQTATAFDGLSWQRLERLDGQPCETTPIVLQASAPGLYSLTLRNREAGSGAEVAGISAIVVTTDPLLDPYDEYAP